MSEPNSASVVTLQPVTPDNLCQVLRLQVAEAQSRFVASNAVSIAEAYFQREHAWFRAICADETPVGFLMVYDDPRRGYYYLWRMMIDAAYQGMGFGRRAMHLLSAHIKTRPGATALHLSYLPGEGSPAPFYEKLGFVETGEIQDGERVLRLDLPSDPANPPPPILGKPLTHIVLFRLQDPSPAVLEETVGRLRALLGRIPSLRDLEVGVNVVPSARAYDIGLIARIDDRAGLDAYQVHPAHQDVLAYMRTVLAGAAAVDFEAEPG